MSLPISLSSLGRYNQFVNWSLVPANPKPLKVPVNIAGTRIDAHDPANWLTVDQAYAVEASTGYGVAFVLSDHDPFSVIDLDHCRDEAGAWSPLAVSICEYFKGAGIEVSQSGNGLHIWVMGTVPDGYKTKNQGIGLEVYSRKRMMSFGNREVWGDAGQSNWTAHLNQFVPHYMEQNIGSALTVSGNWTTEPLPEYTGPLDDAELIRKMLASRTAANTFGTKALFQQLWACDVAALAEAFPDNNPDRPYDASGADLALATHLAFWTGGNCERIERLMWQSALRRDKWTEHRTYLKDLTILKAVTGCVKVYDYIAPDNSFAFGLTDTGNGYRFAAQNEKKVLFCSTWNSWLSWDGTRFQKDIDGEVVRLAKLTATSIYSEAKVASLRSEDKAKEIAKWASKSLDKTRLQAMLWAAQSEIPVSPDSLDQNDDLLNVKNGTLDFRDFVLKEHNPEDFITKIAQVTLDHTAECPEWMRFLQRIFNHNQELIDFIQRAIGYSLTGHTKEHVLFMLYGTGANGKSTFLEVLLELVGEYGAPAEFRAFLSRPNSDSVRNDIAELNGVRLVTSSEVGDGQSLDEATIKQITGGDTIRARFLYQEFFSFKPRLKLWLAVNHKPQIRGADDGIWRRVLLIPFDVTIPPNERDHDLPQKLRGELSGILTWALNGLRHWQKSGLASPEIILQASAAYREESDRLADFIQECCLDFKGQSNKFTTFSDLYWSYTCWCGTVQEKAVAKKTFGTMLEERGYHSDKQYIDNVQKRVRLGLQLKSQLPIV